MVEMVALHGTEDGRQIARLNRQGEGVAGGVMSQLKEFQVEHKDAGLVFTEVQTTVRKNPIIRLGLAKAKSQTSSVEGEGPEGGQEPTNGAEEVNCEDQMCSICLDSFSEGDRVQQLLCKHYYHKDCIGQWLQNHRNCPMCKRDLHEMYVVPDTRGPQAPSSSSRGGTTNATPGTVIEGASFTDNPSLLLASSSSSESTTIDMGEIAPELTLSAGSPRTENEDNAII
jgi:hypothetical protein